VSTVVEAEGVGAMRKITHGMLVMTLVATMLTGLLAGPAFAIEIGSEFAGDYEVVDLEGPPGVPSPLGGLTLMRGDPNTLLIGGAANRSDGAIYAVPLQRDAEGRITGFAGDAELFATAPNIDGGLAYEPSSGVLFYTGYSNNVIGQIKPGSTAPDRVDNVTDNGVASSVGSLGFVPPGSPGAGSFKVISYNGNTFYDMALTAAGDGTFDLGAATLRTDLPGGPEGMAYVPGGSPRFPQPSMLVSLYGANVVRAFEVDAGGNPRVDTGRDFVTSLSGAEGAFLDPTTGEFLFSTFGGGDRVIVVRGFASDTGDDTGTIEGIVSDVESHDPIGGATLSVPGMTSVTTDASGSYTMTGVPAGQHTITASASGYRSASETVTVTAGESVEAYFQLSPVDDGSGEEPDVPDRVAGRDRFETAADISKAFIRPGADVVYVATAGTSPTRSPEGCRRRSIAHRCCS
jgi:hypothetical protein